MTPEAIEESFIVEFSVHGNNIGKSQNKAERRERVRQAIYVFGQMAHKFHGTQMTYAEAFQACYGERLDRRAAQREPVPIEEEDDHEEEPEDDDIQF